VWLRSRQKTGIEEALYELISKKKQDVIDWRDLSTKELAVFYAKLSIEMPEINVPSLVRLWFKKRNPFAGAFSRLYVQRIWRRWYLNIWNPLKWNGRSVFDFSIIFFMKRSKKNRIVPAACLKSRDFERKQISFLR
jgi:hypothetical protein